MIIINCLILCLQSNTLVDLEQRAREQDEHWRGIVSQKEQLISKLQQHASNGEQVREVNNATGNS